MSNEGRSIKTEGRSSLVIRGFKPLLNSIPLKEEEDLDQSC
jgi:hypothetical protein